MTVAAAVAPGVASWTPLAGPPWPFTPVFFEVTNTLTVPYVTGLQRLTREVARHLPRAQDADAPLRMVPIVWCPRLRDYRRLTAAEHVRLTSGPGSTPSTAAAVASRSRSLGEHLPDIVTGRLRRISRSPRAQRTRRWIADRRRPRAAPRPELEALRLDSWPSNGWLLDLEAGWHDPVPRARLLPLLSGIGIRSIAVVADVMPEIHPAWFDTGSAARFGGWLRSHLAHSEHFVCISSCTEADLGEFAASIGVAVDGRTSVIDLGADFLTAEPPTAEPPAADTPGARSTTRPGGPRRLLVVGTLEPRKNQALAIDVFDRLSSDHPDLHLVLVGKQGWLVEDLVQRITTHPLFGERLTWESALDDDDLAARYRSAFLALVPSRYEGFGAPVVEGLARGVPTIASTGGALPEAGGDWCEYADPDDLDAWVRLVTTHLDDEARHRAAIEHVADYPAPSWVTTAEQLLATLTSLVA